MADTVNSILAECAIALGRGIGSKPIKPEAVAFWRVKYEISIGDALKNGGVWKEDRKTVLRMSIKLGRTARGLAGTQIGVAAAKKASKIVANDPTCQPPPGRGRYCPA